MAPVDITKLAVGDRVQHELLVRERDDRTTKAGDPYIVLKVGNATGVLSANVWKEQVPLVQGVRPGQVIQAIGVIEEYQGRRQLKFTAPPRIVPAGAATIEEFLPRITQPEAELWAKVDAWRAEMRGSLRRAVDLFFADEAFRAEFARTPGATRGHHALVGGLLLHSCEVAEIARASAKTMGGDVTLVTAGALLHDIGKTQAYSVSLSGFDYTRAGMLLQHIVLGSLMLEERLATLKPSEKLNDEQRLELHHFILHFADNTSAKGNDFLDALQDSEQFPNAEQEFSAKRGWRLERRVWKRSHRWD
jgi:3'-5' exoribonuclease